MLYPRCISVLVFLHDLLHCTETPLPTVPGPWNCTVLEHNMKHSHQSNKVDFDGQMYFSIAHCNGLVGVCSFTFWGGRRGGRLGVMFQFCQLLQLVQLLSFEEKLTSLLLCFILHNNMKEIFVADFSLPVQLLLGLVKNEKLRQNFIKL